MQAILGWEIIYCLRSTIVSRVLGSTWIVTKLRKVSNFVGIIFNFCEGRSGTRSEKGEKTFGQQNNPNRPLNIVKLIPQSMQFRNGGENFIVHNAVPKVYGEKRFKHSLRTT